MKTADVQRLSSDVRHLRASDRLLYWLEEARELHTMAMQREREAELVVKQQSGPETDEFVKQMRLFAHRLQEAAPSVTRRSGYAPKGQRVYGLTSGHRRPRTSLIAAHIGPDFAEPFLFDGTCDAAVFNSWLRARLCPRLTREHLVIMDNAAFHTSPETAQRIRHTGATLLFLPPYSPDLNPIEHDFAALKKHREYHETASIAQIVKAYQ